MKKDTIQKVVSNPVYIGLLIAGIIILSFLISLLFKGNRSGDTPIKEGQIQIVKGDEIITINQNGLVEYKSKDRSYSETWDAVQIDTFFSMMNRKAKDYLTRRVSGGDCGYKVFMFVDGKFVTICMDSNDEDMADTIEPIFIKYSDIDLSDYFGGDDDGDDSGDEFDGTINFPSSTPSVTRSTPTPTPYSSYNTYTNYAPVKAGCENWSGSIVGTKAIISNTYCTPDSTPTPTP